MCFECDYINRHRIPYQNNIISLAVKFRKINKTIYDLVKLKFGTAVNYEISGKIMMLDHMGGAFRGREIGVLLGRGFSGRARPGIKKQK